MGEQDLGNYNVRMEIFRRARGRHYYDIMSHMQLLIVVLYKNLKRLVYNIQQKYVSEFFERPYMSYLERCFKDFNFEIGSFSLHYFLTNCYIF